VGDGGARAGWPAGANVLKIFESWAEGLSPDLFDRLVINPTRDIHIRGKEPNYV